MKKEIIFLLLVLYSVLSAQSIVINEVLYDPDGSDSGYEWIELYNNTNNLVNLENWQLQGGGTEYVTIFTFPNVEIESYSYLVVGEEYVTNGDINTQLGFQNGGSATDGIRICNEDQSYTDTVLYDEPNDNDLIDDFGNVATSFAPDVAGGNVLIRYPNGSDTDNCASDFLESSVPTPGSENFVPIDLSINQLDITESESGYQLFTDIFNLSTWPVDNSDALLEIYLNNSLINSHLLPTIPAQDSILVETDLGQLEAGYHLCKVILIYNNDSNLDNNEMEKSVLCGESFLIINEILFDPDTENQEWVEIYCRSLVDNFVDKLFLVDAGGGSIPFECNFLAKEYFVVCREAGELQNYYALEDTLHIFPATSWTALNNTEETLWLRDTYGTILDSVSYNGSDCPDNYSIERVNPYSDDSITWEICHAENGATPTKINSVVPLPGDLELQFSAFSETETLLTHSLIAKNIGFNNIPYFQLNLYSSVEGETTENLLISDDFEIGDSLQLQTTKPESNYITFHYEIIALEDDNPENNDCYSFYNANSLPVVINEIMYNPATSDAEWIELKQNVNIPNASHFYFIADEDSILFNQDFEYLIIADSETNAEQISINYNLAEEQVIFGSFSLSNLGETISVCNELGDLIETIDYDPEWSEQKGVSIERINPSLKSDNTNWGPSIVTCTPGRKNSLFVEVLPASTSFSVQPNPFSPFRSEHTVFSIELPETISTITIRIYDLKGREIRKLINQELMASYGAIIWDGKNDSGQDVPIGVYLVHLDATGRTSEKTYRKIETVVIGK